LRVEIKNTELGIDANVTAVAEELKRRETFLPFALPDIDGSEIEEIKEALASGWVTTGPKTKQFESEFAQAVGAKHAIAVNSCTAAMHLALEAIGLKSGDEVITTPYTFAATAEVIRYFDAKPVFVDVEPETFNIDVNQIEQAITPKTRAVIPVHIGGLSAEMDSLHALARKHGIRVIEDAAHAFPALHDGRMVGSLGSDFTCFSFYATKTITTGEGGMICTDNDAYADRCRIMALHGISRDAWKRYTAEGSWYYEITAPGYKYNMTDVAAAMGLAQLRKAKRMLQRRREIARMYNNAFCKISNVQCPMSNSEHSWHLYMLRLNLGESRKRTSISGLKQTDNGQQSPDKESRDKIAKRFQIVNCQQTLKIDRAQFIEELKVRNIGASVHFIPLHLHPYYRETYGYAPEDFPVAYREYMREISLPIYSKMSDEDVDDVIAAVLDIAERYAEVETVAFNSEVG
jgi:dTDP-4-amino-4,6-dideoxygalactose transaminase